MNNRENEIIHASIKIIRKYLDPPKIILFGSRTKDINSKHADFDFAIQCKEPDISVQRKIREDIEKISGLYKIDLVYLLSCDKKFRNIVLKTGEVVYERRN